jgi:hypothetical protein
MEATEAMKAMARRVVAAYYELPEHEVWGDCGEVSIALAAIMETQEAIAAFVESDVSVEHDGQVVGRCSGDMLTATAIRAGEHYALAGDRHG